VLTRQLPFTLHSAPVHASFRHSSLRRFNPPHGQLPLVELQLVQLRMNGLPRSSPRRAGVAVREGTNHSTECRTASSDLLLLEQNSSRVPYHSITHIRYHLTYHSANCSWYSPSQASRRHTTPPQCATDRHRSPSHRAQQSGTGEHVSSRAGWIPVQCNYIKSEIPRLYILLWHCACSLPLAPISHRLSILAALACPSPFTLRSAALYYATLHPLPVNIAKIRPEQRLDRNRRNVFACDFQLVDTDDIEF
jgi:hypothetical protein